MSKKEEKQSCNCHCNCGDSLASSLRSLADAVEECCPSDKKKD